MLTYSVATGIVTLDGHVIGHGYSGAQWGKNNPKAEPVPGIGPIPAGTWHLDGIENGGPTGPFTIVLSPCPGTDTDGRSAFRIHGDSISNPGNASHGCIILPPLVRHQIWDSGQRTLTVV